MIFGKSRLLDLILGGNGKEERLLKEEKRAREARDKLGRAIVEASRTTCEAVKQATCILSEDESEFDVDIELMQAGLALTSSGSDK